MNIVQKSPPPVFTLPLSLYAMIPLADATSQDGEKFMILAGLDARAAKQLKRYSCDETDTDLMRFTSDHERFCIGSYENWYAKRRFPFSLLSSNHELAAAAWFGPRAFPALAKGSMPVVSGAWDTFAIRTYEPYRGKHLAASFSDFVLAEYRKQFPNHPLWLSTPPENIAAIHLYHKLGFSECGVEEDGEIVMT